MKILYISQYFPPEMGAPAARAAELACHWVNAGHEVTVLTGFPNHPTGQVPAAYRRRMRRLIFRETVNGVRVVRTWLLPLPNRKPYERMLNYGSFFLSASLAGLFLEPPDVVIATSPQLLVGLAGWWVARWKRLPFVLEVRDLWPESLEAVGVGDGKSLLNRFLAKVAAFLYRESQRIVVVTPAFREHLLNRLGVSREKISIVENGVETDRFHPDAVDAGLRRKLGAGGRFVVSYVGTIGMAHGLGTLLDAAAQLQVVAPQVLLMVVGEGAEKERIMSLAQSGGLANIRFVEQQPRERIPAYICAADACLVMLKKDDVFKTVIPTKLLEFMSCGRPVILGVDGQAREVVETSAAGIFVEPEDSGSLAEAIMRLATDPGLCGTLGRNGRSYAVAHFSRRKTAQIYIDVLERMLERNALSAAA